MGVNVFQTPTEYDETITAVRRRILFLANQFPSILHARNKMEFRRIVGYSNVKWKKQPTELQFRIAVREARAICSTLSN